ncbi:hydantoinase B/oxoprolinase family protein [Hydrogenophaga sp.]|uniref:hydantoinase B/oxoprolinase family protein n=1 Tax=Hydrogenophaga sp. TaxID=1904254 RepID=UPI0027181DDE|nr:hydantoinase B/oxoprolinase family protein [Hydrogenophaga sp.]MDO9437053.1 hydantoinase B/oxoprolinase family protein [Hydrogenophaga sp.]
MRRGNIDMQILWNRLIAICEEQAQTMMRAAFSPPVREAGDLSAGLFDLQGHMIAQAVTGTPGHINSMATAVVHFLDRFPIATMKPGDAFITNDPWLASGHLNDVTIVSPAFHQGRVAGLFAATVHLTDVGGRGMGPDGRDLFEEGVLIPHMYLVREGQLNHDLLAIMRSNSREPLQVEGDILAIIAAGEAGCRSLVETLVEFNEPDVQTIAAYILETSTTATIEAIRQLKQGTFRHSMEIDGYDKPVTIAVAMTVREGLISLDFEGTSEKSDYGINVVLAYTAAYSVYGIKCVVAPEVPSNHGSLSVFDVMAPRNSILNPEKPAPVSARHIIGHVLPDAVMGCLEQALPGRTVAASGMMWNPYIRGAKGLEGEDRIWELFSFLSAGMGARSSKDGLSATAFPGGMKGIPVEAIETIVPIVFWQKELRPDSGGAGQFRGGMGQSVQIGSLADEPLRFQAMFERVDHPAPGVAGGLPGAAGTVSLSSGLKLRGKGGQALPPGERLVLQLPGGGGYGPAAQRDPQAIQADIEQGFVSAEAAQRDYGFSTNAVGVAKA